MSKSNGMSTKTRTNWLIDAAVFTSGLIATLSGIYFLFLPSGGYQGGRNPFYGVIILFARRTWEDLHLWAGVAMIVAVIIHFSIHWNWVTAMAKRIWKSFGSAKMQVSKGARVNLIVNLVIAVSFLLTAASGVYFLFAPAGGYQGGSVASWDPGFLFSRTVWDLIHTWAGTVMIVTAVIHFVIHWGWISKVTSRFFGSLGPQPVRQSAMVVK